MPQKQKNAMSDLIHTVKYANWNHSENRRETYSESVDRIFDMFEAKFLGKGRFLSYHNEKDLAVDIDGLQKVIDKGREFVKAKKGLTSQRAAQFGGIPALRKNARIFNCAFSFLDRPRFFQEAVWLALCGTGTGFSIMPQHVNKLPPISKPIGSKKIIVIEDSIEGWADAFGALMSSYFDTVGDRVEFDYSQIRPNGSPISHGMGKAPGHKPLAKSIEMIREFLENVINSGFEEYTNDFDLKFKNQNKLRPHDVQQISLMMADCVLSGGVRRTANMTLFHPDDHATRDCKLGEWWIERPYLAHSNNSALFARGDVTFKQFKALMAQSRASNGDPAFFFASNEDQGTNPCGEVGFCPRSPTTGESGWGVCNLVTNNISACDSADDVIEGSRILSGIATMQAGFTDFDYLGKATEEIAKHEALIGVSMTGIMTKPHLVFDADTMEKSAKAVLEENERVAKMLGINVAARATCIKPEGTGSIVLGTTANGIHVPHAHKFLRRITCNVTSSEFKHYLKHAPECTEIDIYDRNKGYICFAIEEPETSVVRGDTDALMSLEHVKFLKKHWVDAGKRRDRCLDPTTENNVSNTITVKEHEWGELTRAMFQSRNTIAGVSFVGENVDIAYYNAPNVKIGDPSELSENHHIGTHAYPWLQESQHDYEKRLYVTNKWKACKNSKPVDLSQMEDDAPENIKITQTVACSGGSCEVI